MKNTSWILGKYENISCGRLHWESKSVWLKLFQKMTKKIYGSFMVSLKLVNLTNTFPKHFVIYEQNLYFWTYSRVHIILIAPIRDSSDPDWKLRSMAIRVTQTLLYLQIPNLLKIKDLIWFTLMLFITPKNPLIHSPSPTNQQTNVCKH